MGEFAVGQGVPRFEDPRLLKGGGRYVDDIVLPGMAFGFVLRSPHAHANISSIDRPRRRLRPAWTARFDRRGLEALRLGRSAGARRPEAPRRQPAVPLSVSRAGAGTACAGSAIMSPSLSPRPTLRRCRRRRADRGRLRGAALRHRRPRMRSRRCARRSGTIAPTISASCTCVGDKAATDAAFARADHVVKHRFVINRVTAVTHGAARLRRRLRPDRRPLHAVSPRRSARTPSARISHSRCSRCPRARSA